MAALLRPARLVLVASALAAGLGCDPFDIMPPPKWEDLTCEQICAENSCAFGCFEDLGDACSTAARCTGWCEEQPNVTQELLNCMQRNDVYQVDKTRFRPDCEFALGLPDTSTGRYCPGEGPGGTPSGTPTGTPTGSTPAIPRVGTTVEVRGTVPGGTAPRLAAAYVRSELSEPYLVSDVAVTEPLTGLPASLELPAATAVGRILESSDGVAVVVYAFDDLDGDGAHGSGEPILAAPSTFPLWIERSAVYPLGWTTLQYVGGFPADTTPSTTTLAPVDLVALAPRPTLDLSGTHGSAVLAAVADGWATVWIEESPLEPTRLVDAPLPAVGQPLIASIATPAPASHLSQDDPFPQGAAVELLVAYADVDGDGALGDGDALQAFVCASASEAAAAVWLPVEVDRVDDWWAGWRLGMVPGWNLVALDPDLSGDLRVLAPTTALTTSDPTAACAAIP